MDSHFIKIIKLIMAKCAIDTLPRPLTTSSLFGSAAGPAPRWTGGQVDNHIMAKCAVDTLPQARTSPDLLLKRSGLFFRAS